VRITLGQIKQIILEEVSKSLAGHVGEITRRQLQKLIREEIEIAAEGKKAAKGKGKPYGKRRRGKTESQAQQMAAGIALRAREEGTKKDAIRKLKGASKSMAKMSLKDLRKLATIRRGSEVPDSTKKGHERAALPGHVKMAKLKEFKVLKNEIGFSDGKIMFNNKPWQIKVGMVKLDVLDLIQKGADLGVTIKPRVPFNSAQKGTISSQKQVELSDKLAKGEIFNITIRTKDGDDQTLTFYPV